MSIARRGRLIGPLAFPALLAALVVSSLQDVRATGNEGAVRWVQTIKTRKVGIPSPIGLAYSPRADAFVVVTQPGATPLELSMVGHFLEPRGSARIKVQGADAINMTFDTRTNRLLLLDPRRSRLFEVVASRFGRLDGSRVMSTDVRHFGVVDPQGTAADPASGRLFILDAAMPRVLRVDRDAAGTFEAADVGVIGLEPLGAETPRGLAFDPATGHLHVLVPAARRLYELTERGDLVTIRDLSRMGLKDPRGLAFAPSSDTTDDPARQNLYVSDAGGRTSQASGSREAGSVGGIVELSFSATATATAASSVSSLVALTLTSQFNPPSPDPSGITYLPDSGTLWECDSEVEETVNGITHFANVQAWEMRLGGSVLSTHNVQAFSNEPTGVTVNPANRHLFYTDDNKSKVFEVNPGPDGVYHTSDDVVTSFSTSAFGMVDTEDAAYVPALGALFIVDEINSEVYRVSPGANGIFDGVAPTGDDVVTHFDTEGLGILGPEGVAHNPDNGHLYVVAQSDTIMWEITTAGALVQTIDISALNLTSDTKLEGLTLAPSSLNPSERHAYVVDREVDNDSDPNENDGRLYEMTLPGSGSVNQAPVVNAGVDLAINLPSAANLDGTVSDDGLPNPPASVTTTWTKVSGPGTVTFGNALAVDTTASFSVAGSYVLRLTANDSVLSSSDDVTITVSPAANQAPLVGAGADQTVWLPASALLNGTVSDDGLPNPPGAITSTWSKLSGPGTVTFGDPNLVSTTASFSEVGVYVLRLSATDSELSASDDVTVLVNDSQNQANRQPTPSPWVPVP